MMFFFEDSLIFLTLRFKGGKKMRLIIPGILHLYLVVVWMPQIFPTHLNISDPHQDVSDSIPTNDPEMLDTWGVLLQWDIVYSRRKDPKV